MAMSIDERDEFYGKHMYLCQKEDGRKRTAGATNVKRINDE